MNKIVRLALACGALMTTLVFTPQPAKALCSPGPVGVVADPADQWECRVLCREVGCSSYYTDPTWGICYCS